MYDVKFVKSEELPEGHDWFIARRGDDFVFMLDPSRLTEAMLCDAWVAFTRLDERVPTG